MNRIRANKRLLVLALFLAAGGVLLCAGLVPRKGECYVKCSPVIAVTNYPYFSALLKSLVQDRLIADLKLSLSEKLNVAFLPGSFRVLETGLRKVTDVSSLVESLVNDGLGSQLSFVRTRMSVEVFSGRLNKAVLAVLRRELRQLGCEENQIREVVDDYKREFLKSRRALRTYADQAGEFQAMTAEFLPVSAKLLSRMTVLGGKMDVADGVGVRRKPGSHINGNTRQIIEECAAHMQRGLGNIAAIAEISLADSIGKGFCGASDGYLAGRLESLRGSEGKVALSSAHIDKIIESVDKAASGAPSEYIRTTTATLADMATGTRGSLSKGISDGIASALSALNGAMSLEKEKECAISRLYSGIEEEVKGLLGDTGLFAAAARQHGGVSLLDRKSVKKIAVLLAGRNSSMLLRRLAVKHYIAARISLETAAAVRSALSAFDPGIIDRGYEDMAWKDLARFNYYLLCLENQRLKLLALRAMTESLGTEDPDVVGYAQDCGLPEGF